jgi:general secretion pathway protein E
MHMGLDLYNVVAALNGVLAQRLMRINCRHCLQPLPVTAAQLQALEITAESGDQFLQGVGCSHCRGTGYKGRRAVSELLCLDDELRDLIAARAPMSRIKEAARGRGMRTLREAAVALVRRGESTLEELDRVTLAD